MTDNINLKVMSCPTCGASLKAENNTEAIVCVYCGNTIVPVVDTPVRSTNMSSAGAVGVVKIEGIKTPSSALAYMDLFFEEYDWDAFAYAQAISIPEMDKLANSMQTTSADDKTTWLLGFKAIFEPFYRKIEGCGKIFTEAVEKYKKNGQRK